LAGSVSTAYHLELAQPGAFSEGTECSLCQMDDILVFGKTDAELDENLEETEDAAVSWPDPQ